MKSRIKIWAGVGAYILASGAMTLSSVTVSAEPMPADSAQMLISQQTPALPPTAPSGGEGGEGGEGEAPAFQDKLSGEALTNALKKGGYVIYFRHAQTEKDYADQINAKIGDCSTQRMLSAVGWEQARTIGKGFESLQIPVGEVYSSEYCRAWQTADLAFGRYETRPELNFLPFEEYTDAQVAQMKETVMPLLAATPEPGKNTVIVGHDDLLEAAIGIYPEPQGIAYILKPDGRGGVEVIANVLVEEWETL